MKNSLRRGVERRPKTGFNQSKIPSRNFLHILHHTAGLPNSASQRSSTHALAAIQPPEHLLLSAHIHRRYRPNGRRSLKGPVQATRPNRTGTTRLLAHEHARGAHDTFDNWTNRTPPDATPRRSDRAKATATMSPGTSSATTDGMDLQNFIRSAPVAVCSSCAPTCPDGSCPSPATVMGVPHRKDRRVRRERDGKTRINLQAKVDSPWTYTNPA